MNFELNMEPSQEAIDAVYNKLPFNDILNGDLSKDLSKEEIKKLLEIAYSIDLKDLILKI